MRKRSFKEPIEEATINLTPLIDVVFVVLIMFIIVAPLLEIDKVELSTAAPKENKIMPESSPLTIHVRSDNSIWFQSKCISEKELLILLKDAKKRYPQKCIQLYHDKKAAFGTYQAIKNAVELSGFDELDVILQPG